MSAIYAMLLGFLPPWFQVVVLVGIAVLLLVLVVAIVQAVLNALPFL